MALDNNFEAVARDWFDVRKDEWAPKYAFRVIGPPGGGFDTTRDVSAHGFRVTARNPHGEQLEVDERFIEAQLAHAVKDTLGRAYNRTKFIEHRRQMMQVWADYLDDLRHQRTRSNVITLTFQKTG